MIRFLGLAGLIATFAGVFWPADSARAQFNNIFSDQPRPPGAIPRGNPQQAPDDEEDVPDLPQGRVLPAPTRLPQGQPAPMPGPVQSQPLPPPSATTVVPRNAPPSTAAAPPAAAPQQGKPAPPAPATLQPGDEIVTEPPAVKIVNKRAVFSGLDKITGRIINFDEQIGETVQFGALRVKTDACYTRPATEAANTDAFVEVDEITLKGEVKRIFSGWMFAASPGLHAVEHPIYDIWLTDCKEPENTVVSAAPEPPRPAPPPATQKRQPRPQRQPAAAQQRQPVVAPPPPAPPPQQQGFFPPFFRQ